MIDSQLGLTDQIIKGDVSEIRVVPADGNLAVDSVDVTVHATGDLVTISPSTVVIAARTGMKRLIESMVDDSSFKDIVVSAGDTEHIRDAILEQAAKITHERLHRICIQGSKDILPSVNLLLAAQQTIVVSADVDSQSEPTDENGHVDVKAHAGQTYSIDRVVDSNGNSYSDQVVGDGHTLHIDENGTVDTIVVERPENTAQQSLAVAA